MQSWKEDLLPYQVDGVEFLISKQTDGGNAGLFDSMGLGKEQPLDCKVLTPEGWRIMGSLKVGDYVIGSNGAPTRVLGVFPQGRREVFRVTFNDGAQTECGDEHLWLVNTPSRRYLGYPPRVLPLSEIRTSLRDSAGNRRHCIPMVEPVAFSTKNFPIDPYLLGVLLGDGCITRGSVGFSTGDADLMGFVKDAIPPHMAARFKSKYDAIITSPLGQPNPIMRALKTLGLQGHGSDTKFIPPDYLLGSIDQRTALLQGLLDTDGYVSREGLVQFSSNSKSLADGVAELTMSLGGNARRTQKISASGKDHYLVTICLPKSVAPCRIARKLARYAPRQKYKPVRLFSSVESVGIKPTQCIKVEAEDQLYVTDDYIVTHNTVQAIRGADALNLQRTLVVCPAIARVNWLREFQKWQQTPRSIFIVKTSRAQIPDDSDVVIVSYDMLANKDFQRNIANFKFDVLIADEAHATKNRKALRTQALYGERLDGSGIMSLAKRVWILTGTPMPNNASEIYTHLRALAPDRVRVEDGRLTYVQFVNRFCIVERKQFGMRVVERILGNKNVVDLKNRLAGFYIRRRKEEVLKELPPLQWGTIVLEPEPAYRRDLKKLEAGSEAQKIQMLLDAAAANHQGDGKLADEIMELMETNKRGLASLRRLLGLAKVDPTIELVKNELENPGKIILFCYHRDVIDRLATGLKEFNPVVIVGETTPAARQEHIDKFQKDTETRVFIGQITATNSAITLTASDNVLLVEPSWNPAENAQAAARAHRIGQKSSCVLARYVVLAGSLDEVIVKVLLRKSKQISEIML